MLRGPMVVLLLLAAATTATACSLALDDFREAAWVDENTVATTLENQAILLDLSDGSTTQLSSGFFHRLAGEPSRAILAHSVQTGLDSMCEGPGHLEIVAARTGGLLHRFEGHHRPLAASPAGAVAGVDGMQRVRLLDWDAPEDARTVRLSGLPDDPYARTYGYAAALGGDGRILALAARNPAELRLIDLETGSPWRGLAPLSLSDTPLDADPALAFQPDGTRLAVLFTTAGRDHLAALDTAEDPPVLREIHRFPAPAEAWRGPVAAWAGGGVATVHGSATRHVTLGGEALEVILEEGEEALHAVADPDGARWAILTVVGGHAHRVLMFVGDAQPVAAWQREDTEWALHPLPPGTVQPVQDGAGDGSWTMAPDTPERGASGPALVLTLAAVLLAAGRVQRVRGRLLGRPRSQAPNRAARPSFQKAPRRDDTDL